MFAKLDWLTVNQLIAYHKIISICKIRKSGEPEYLARLLRDENRGGKIILQNTQLTLARRSFIWRGSQQWNLLSVELRRSTKISLFKKGARSWVVENISQYLDQNSIIFSRTKASDSSSSVFLLSYTIHTLYLFYKRPVEKFI